MTKEESLNLRPGQVLTPKGLAAKFGTIYVFIRYEMTREGVCHSMCQPAGESREINCVGYPIIYVSIDGVAAIQPFSADFFDLPPSPAS